MIHTLVNWIENRRKELFAAGNPVNIAQPKQPDGQDGMPKPAFTTPPKGNGAKTSKGGQMAQHVAKHVQDPLGSTQDMFQDLGQKKLAYEMAQEDAKRQLLPVQSVLDHVSDTHNLNPDEAMGWQDPNDPQNMMPANMPNGANQTPNGQVPPNMAQTPGQMNTNRPSQSGFGPGKSPGPQQSVRPGKMGVPQPGGGGGNPSNPSAKPAGQSSPGKKAGAAGKGKAGSGKKIKLSIESAQANDHGIRPKVPKLDSMVAAADLNCIGFTRGGPIASPGGSSGFRTGGPGMGGGERIGTGGSMTPRGGPAMPTRTMLSKKKKALKAGGPGSGRRPGFGGLPSTHLPATGLRYGETPKSKESLGHYIQRNVDRVKGQPTPKADAMFKNYKKKIKGAWSEEARQASEEARAYRRKRDPQARYTINKETKKIELPLTDREKKASEFYKKTHGIKD